VDLNLNQVKKTQAIDENEVREAKALQNTWSCWKREISRLKEEKVWHAHVIKQIESFPGIEAFLGCDWSDDTETVFEPPHWPRGRRCSFPGISLTPCPSSPVYPPVLLLRKGQSFDREKRELCESWNERKKKRKKRSKKEKKRFEVRVDLWGNQNLTKVFWLREKMRIWFLEWMMRIKMKNFSPF